MNLIMRFSTVRTIKKMMVILVIFVVLSMWFISRNFPQMIFSSANEHATVYDITIHQKPQTGNRQESHISQHERSRNSTIWKSEQVATRLPVLVLIEQPDSMLTYNITVALKANHIDLAAVSVKDHNHWPTLEHEGTGKFSVIIFESILSYSSLDRSLLQSIHEYCKKYNVGIVAFAAVSKHTAYASTKHVGDLPIVMDHRLSLQDLVISPTASDVLHITKAGQRINGSLPYSSWTGFTTNHSSYRHIVQAESQKRDSNSIDSPSTVLHTTMLLDEGLYDGIQRIFIGNDLRFWLHYILFLDSISYLSHGLMQKSLDRYIQVDIDDVFVGAKGTRITTSDVEDLVLKQQHLAKRIPGFIFKLGFSGMFFKNGSESENEGDETLVKNAHKFSWFPHMWNHAQTHMHNNQGQLISEMHKNYQFAKTHNILVEESYSVSPHHSGVYPAQIILYNAWKHVWDIKVTSTEEYPALYPSWKRKGFIFKDIMVLPRQTCGLFTHTIRMKEYPGGRERLDGSIHGGELFQTIVDNPINVYMTHTPNYRGDRLGLYTFDKLVTFVQKWTNLKLKSEPPIKLAQMYFEMFPHEREPLWTNPCEDRRHLVILPINQNCRYLPNLLVIGPQKTGTSALTMFLSLHPNIARNIPSKDTFEELQFFSNSNNYVQGLEWYTKFFPPVGNSKHYVFETSATYFDHAYAPMRAHSLLSNSKLITILIDPAKRAYSWYQHERAHGNPASMNHTFYDVITSSGPETDSQVPSLRNRCLDPGKYVQHLQRWLQYYPAEQLMVLDGDLLKADPVAVMSKIQQFLQMKEVIDFSGKIIYDAKKGFYCPVKQGHTHCLGEGKGRSYPAMDSRSKEYLHLFYQDFNNKLKSYLIRINQPVPIWLDNALAKR